MGTSARLVEMMRAAIVQSSVVSRLGIEGLRNFEDSHFAAFGSVSSEAFFHAVEQAAYEIASSGLDRGRGRHFAQFAQARTA